MKINMAHLRERAAAGGWIHFAVFEAKSTTGENDELLFQLTAQARGNGLRVDQSALAYSSGGRIRFHGHPNLVNYLAKSWRPVWTHILNI